MKALIYSPYDTRFIEERLKAQGIEIGEEPDVVLTYGGDGTILQAEREYAGVPKIPIKKSALCSQCEVVDPQLLDIVLKKLKEGKYRVEEREKVQARIEGKRLVGLNEIQVHNTLPYRALRFTVRGSGLSGEEFIGDGLLAATSFGSAAYFKAMGGQEFTTGIQVGFNNCMPRKKPFTLTEPLQVTIVREDALVIADNQEEMITLEPGKGVTIEVAEEKARFVRF